MDTLQAVVIVLAYSDQGKLSGAQRRLLMTAREALWKAAETVRIQAER